MSAVSPARRNTKKSGARPSRTPAGDAFSWLAFQVLRLSGLLTSAGDAMSAPAGQTSARWQVLAAVEDAPASVAQIARNLGLARQSVQRVADLLERDGLAVYEDNPNHRRAKLLRLTRQGRTALHAIQTVQRGWADELGGRIGVADLRKASAVLERVTEAVSRGLSSTEGD